MDPLFLEQTGKISIFVNSLTAGIAEKTFKCQIIQQTSCTLSAWERATKMHLPHYTANTPGNAPISH